MKNRIMAIILLIIILSASTVSYAVPAEHVTTEDPSGSSGGSFGVGPDMSDLITRLETAIKETADATAKAELINTFFDIRRPYFEKNYEIASRSLTPENLVTIAKVATISNFTKPYEETLLESVTRIESILGANQTFIDSALKESIRDNKYFFLYKRTSSGEYMATKLEEFLDPEKYGLKHLYIKTDVQSSELLDKENMQLVYSYNNTTNFYRDLILRGVYKSLVLEDEYINIDMFGNIVYDKSKKMIFPSCLNNSLLGTGTMSGIKPGTLIFAKNFLNTTPDIVFPNEIDWELGSPDKDNNKAYTIKGKDSEGRKIKDNNLFNLNQEKAFKFGLTGKSSNEELLGRYALDSVKGEYKGDKLYGDLSDFVVSGTPSYRITYSGKDKDKHALRTSTSRKESTLVLGDSDLEVEFDGTPVFSTYTYETTVNGDAISIDHHYISEPGLVTLLNEHEIAFSSPVAQLDVISVLGSYMNYYTGISNSPSIKTNPIKYDSRVFTSGAELSGDRLPDYKLDNFKPDVIKETTIEDLTKAYPVILDVAQPSSAFKDLNINYAFYLYSFNSKIVSSTTSSGKSTELDELAAQATTKSQFKNVLEAANYQIKNPAEAFFNKIKSGVSYLHNGVNSVFGIGIYLDSKSAIVDSGWFDSVMRVYALLIVTVALLFVVITAIKAPVRTSEYLKARALTIVKLIFLYLAPVMIFVGYLGILDASAVAIYNSKLSRLALIDAESATMSYRDASIVGSSSTAATEYFLKYSSGNASALLGSGIRCLYYNEDGGLDSGIIHMSGKLSAEGSDNLESFYKEDKYAIPADATTEFRTPNIDLYDKSLYFYFYDNFAHQYKLYTDNIEANAIDENNLSPIITSSGNFVDMIKDPAYAKYSRTDGVDDILGLGRLFYKDPVQVTHLVDEVSDSYWYSQLLKSPYVTTEYIRGGKSQSSGINALGYPQGIIWGTKLQAPIGTMYTKFEQKLHRVNEKTYFKMLSLFKDSKVSDESVLRVAAAEALFVFNKEFSSINPLRDNIGVTSYDTNSVTIDTVIRSISTPAGAIDYKTNIVKLIDDKAGILGVLLLVFVDLAMFLANVTTFIALTFALILTLLNFTVGQGLFTGYNSSAVKGSAITFVLLAAVRLLLITTLNLLSVFGLRETSSLTTMLIMMYVLLALIVAFSIVSTGNLAICVVIVKNWISMGMVVYTATAKAIKDKITETVSNVQNVATGVNNETESMTLNYNNEMSSENGGDTTVDNSTEESSLVSKAALLATIVGHPEVGIAVNQATNLSNISNSSNSSASSNVSNAMQDLDTNSIQQINNNTASERSVPEYNEPQEDIHADDDRLDRDI